MNLSDVLQQTAIGVDLAVTLVTIILGLLAVGLARTKLK